LLHRRSLILLLLIIGEAPSAVAEETPLWEAGLGLGAFAAPDYRGADEGGTTRASFNVSASLGPPSNSTNGARSGMPDLDPTVEIGPSLDIQLDRPSDRQPSLTLRLPLRTVIATDFSRSRNVGWVFLPNLSFDFKDTGPGGGWTTGISVGPIFATKAYHDYYYTVRPEFATPTRPAFDARGGYSGASVALTMSKRFDGYWVGGFLRYDYLRGAVFDDSPLVRSSGAVLAGIAFSKIIARSSEPARSRQRDP
jgi:outer membrane scaffolding protein for murein synthesis (MipA/OmpV family)